MQKSQKVVPLATRGKRRSAGVRVVLTLGVLVVTAAFSPPARAVDGCLVLLCFAAPSWRAIPQCVPPIR